MRCKTLGFTWLLGLNSPRWCIQYNCRNSRGSGGVKVIHILSTHVCISNGTVRLQVYGTASAVTHYHTDNHRVYSCIYKLVESCIHLAAVSGFELPGEIDLAFRVGITGHSVTVQRKNGTFRIVQATAVWVLRIKLPPICDLTSNEAGPLLTLRPTAPNVLGVQLGYACVCV